MIFSSQPPRGGSYQLPTNAWAAQTGGNSRLLGGLPATAGTGLGGFFLPAPLGERESAPAQLAGYPSLQPAGTRE